MKITADAIKKYIDERINAKESISVKMVAKHFKNSRQWLDDVFRPQTDTTLKEYIQYSRFLFWIECLVKDKTVLTKNIHKEMGVSRSTFYRCLKKYSQCSVKYYRVDPTRPKK